ncbi:hypothetical protein GM182_01075 [bacterium 3DAC]|nr:hypothetical protein GM182_01075 [bacterium 3DAC]
MRRKVYIAFAVVVSLFIGSIAGLVWAQSNTVSTTSIHERWQTVYVIGNKRGEADKVIVVDMLKTKGNGGLQLSIPVNVPIDRVKPYTDDINVSYNDGKILLTADSATGTIYYRADVPYTTGVLPFDYSLKWYFDGKEVDPNTIIGKTGTVKLVVSMKSNYKIDDTYVPFLGMVNVQIDTSHASNVETDSMPPMVVGSYYQVSGIVMALDEEKSTYVQWHATDFQYPDIKIVVMPHFMEVSLPDMAGPLQELVDNIDKLAKLPDAHEKIVKELYSGIDPEKVGELASGLKQMDEGLAQIVAKLDASLSQPESMDTSKLQQMEDNLRLMAKALDGYYQVLSGLADGHQKLMAGASQLEGGLSQLQTGVEKTHDGLGQLYQASQQLVEGSHQLKGSLSQVSGGVDKLAEGLVPIVGGLEKETEGLKFMATGTQGVPSLSQLAQKVAPSDPQMAQVLMAYQRVASDTLKGHIQLVQGMKTWQTSFTSMVGGIKQISDGMDKLDTSIVQLSAGLGQVYMGTASLSQGVAALHGGASQLNQGLQQEYKVIVALRDGGEIKPGVSLPSLKKLASGLNQMADGVHMLRQALQEKSVEAQQMVENMKKLRDGLAQIQVGLDKAYKGTLQLQKGMEQMKDVLKVLAYGGTLQGKDVPSIAKTSEYLREMASKLQEKVNDIKKSQEEIDKYKEVAKKYTSFMGRMENVPSHVVFVIVPK